MRFRRSSQFALVLLVVVLTTTLTSRFRTAQVARSLTCAESIAPSDAILIENFDPNYLLFERAEALERAGLAPTALVPVEASAPNTANLVSSGIAEVMAHYARLRAWRTIPIGFAEPISLNAALQIRRRLVDDGIRPVVVVTPGFRSRR